MSALAEVFARTRNENRAALIGYLPAGYPSVDLAAAAMTAMVEGGCDIIEVGLPYSDPLLDGPTIQAAVDVALDRGIKTPDVFATVTKVAATGAPTLVMSYWNPIARYGLDRFASDLAAAAGAGTITVDITPDVAVPWLRESAAHGIDSVFLVAPSSTDERLTMTARAATGFVYVSAVMGVTGARAEVGGAAEHLVERVRNITDKPLCVGLGVSTAQQAAEVARYADGVIVGSAFVQRMIDAESAGQPERGIEDVAALAAELAAGVRLGRTP